MERKLLYLRGWLDPDNMLNSRWLDTWQKAAKDVNEAGRELVVFDIPKVPMRHCSVSNGEIINAIDALIESHIAGKADTSVLVSKICAVEIPFPKHELRDGEEVRTWMQGWEEGYKAAKKHNA